MYAGKINVLKLQNVQVDYTGYWLTLPDEGVDIKRERGSSTAKLPYGIYHQWVKEGNLTRNVHLIGRILVIDVVGHQEPGIG